MSAALLTSPIPTPPTKREAVYQRLKQAIADGELYPGQHLVETEIAAWLGVSRNPVREALRKLEQDQLVYASTQGLVVSPITRSRIEEVYGIRALLEGYGCRLAAERITPEECERLFSSLECSRQSLQAGDMESLAECDLEFHAIIIEASGNETLKQVLDQLRDYVLRFRRMSIGLAGRPEEILAEHTAIAEAVAAGRGEEAERLTREHLLFAAQRLLASFGPSGLLR